MSHCSNTAPMNDIQNGYYSEPAPENRSEETQIGTLSRIEPHGNLSEATPQYRKRSILTNGIHSDQRFSDRAVSELLIRVLGGSESVTRSVKDFNDTAE